MVLGSGAARGLAHIGVIRALLEKHVRIDMVAGSSMGAIIGAYYAKNLEIESLANVVLSIEWQQLLRLADPNLSLKGVIQGKKVKEFLKTLIGDIDFKDLKIPLSIVATDLNTAEQVLFNKGSVLDAVRASISIPGIFTPVQMGSSFLIDGGVVDPVPVKVVREMGANTVIASNVISKVHEINHNGSLKAKDTEKSVKNGSFNKLKQEIGEFLSKNKPTLVEHIEKYFGKLRRALDLIRPSEEAEMPNMFETLIQAINSMEYEIAKNTAKDADIVITPKLRHIGLLEFYRGKELISIGYETAKKTI